MADVWELYGVNALDIWRLPFADFLAMTEQIDRVRKETPKNG